MMSLNTARRESSARREICSTVGTARHEAAKECDGVQGAFQGRQQGGQRQAGDLRCRGKMRDIQRRRAALQECCCYELLFRAGSKDSEPQASPAPSRQLYSPNPNKTPSLHSTRLRVVISAEREQRAQLPHIVLGPRQQLLSSYCHGLPERLPALRLVLEGA